MAVVTDYDVWHQTEEEVSVEIVIANLVQNVGTSRRIIADVVSRVPKVRECVCESALNNAIITSKEHIQEETKRKLGPLVSRYL